MATQDMVDYHTEILSSVLTKPVDEDNDDSDPLVDVEFFRLHGSMTQKDRTDVFKTFRLAKSGVLLCTVSSRRYAVKSEVLLHCCFARGHTRGNKKRREWCSAV